MDLHQRGMTLVTILCDRHGARYTLKQFETSRSRREILCNGRVWKMASSLEAILRLRHSAPTLIERLPFTFPRSLNMKTHKLTPRLLVAGLALSLGLAANSFAMPRGEPGNGPGFAAHGQGMHFGHGFQGMQRLHDDLKLDAKQEAQWQDAQKFAKDSFDGAREQGRKQHEEFNAALSQPGADLRALLKRMDDVRAERQKQHDAVRDRWLSVYDTLNAEQKEKVRLFFKAGSERMGRHMDRRGMRPPVDGPAGKDAQPQRRN